VFFVRCRLRLGSGKTCLSFAPSRETNSAIRLPSFPSPTLSSPLRPLRLCVSHPPFFGPPSPPSRRPPLAAPPFTYRLHSTPSCPPVQKSSFPNLPSPLAPSLKKVPVGPSAFTPPPPKKSFVFLSCSLSDVACGSVVAKKPPALSLAHPVPTSAPSAPLCEPSAFFAPPSLLPDAPGRPDTPLAQRLLA
jgi:hypothetical protein